jgi:hypothetical protein
MLSAQIACTWREPSKSFVKFSFLRLEFALNIAKHFRLPIEAISGLTP